MKAEVTKPLLQNRNFVLLMLAQAISDMGDGVYALGLLWSVKLLTGSGANMSGVLAAEALPTVALGLLAGVLVDRGRKRRIMQVADLVRAVTIAVVGILWQMKVANLWAFVVAAVIMSSFSTFFSPARSVALRTVVDKDVFQKALSVSQSLQTVIGLAAPALAAVLLGINPALTFYFDAATFTISLLFITAVRDKSLSVQQEVDSKRMSIREGLAQGLKTVFTSALLRNLVIYMFLLNLMLAPIAVLVPLYAQNVQAMAILETVFTLGMFAGAVVTGFMGMVRKVYALCLGLSLIMLSFGALSFVHPIWLAAVCCLVAGIGSPIANITMSTIFSLTVPRDILGRASSLVRVVVQGASPGSLALTGTLLILCTARQMFLYISIFGLVTILLMAINSSIRRA